MEDRNRVLWMYAALAVGLLAFSLVAEAAYLLFWRSL